MNNRLNKHQLFEVLSLWNNFLRRRVHLVACGGTAMTLLEVKPSTKDVDFDDCVSLFKSQGEHIEIDKLVGHFNELVDYDVGEIRIRPHMNHFLNTLKEEGLI